MKHRVTFLLGVSALLFAFSPGLAQAADWRVPTDFVTIQLAIDSASVVDGDTILVAPGYYAGALVTKAVEIKGTGGAVINSGPPLGPFMTGFFFAGSGAGSGATISHLRFETVEFPVFSRGADDVTVTQTTMVNPIQGISNWRGNRWNITQNEILDLQTSCGGGIGILVADWTARQGGIQDNVVAHNKISGTLHVSSGDCGGYNGTGIVLFADFRWGAPGAVNIAYNRVVKNKVSLTSDTPLVVDVVAIELTDTRDLIGVIANNAIGFNDLRGTVFRIALTPTSLDGENNISRNLGDTGNRGHGLHPKPFVGPEGN